MGMRINQAGNQAPGQGMSATLSEEEKKKQQEQPQAQEQNQPTQLATQAGTAQASAVKAAPKQQKAGTGTFANLKSYLQAAQGGGQQKIAQAATQKVQNVATGAQKGISQATQTFGKQLEAGSLANMGTAAKDVQAAIDAARGTVYQAQQPIAAPERPIDRTIGGPAYRVGINPPPNPIERATQDYLKNLLGGKYQDYRNEMDNRSFLNPDGSKMELGDILQSRKKIFEKYGIDQTKLPGYRDSNLEDDVRRNMPMDPNRIITWGPESLIGRENINAKLDTEIPAQPTTPTAPTSAEVTPEQQQRFADIINAKYGGPGSLQEAGLYNRAAEKARTAQEAIKQTQTAAGREQLLRNIFSQNRDYSGKLDALLLNASQQGVGQLQQQAQQAGNLQQKLQQAQTESANLATGRAKEIADIQQQAREKFTSSQKEEIANAEKRIEEMTTKPVLDENKQPVLKADGTPMTEWDRLPEYLRGVLANSVKQSGVDNTAYIENEKKKVLANKKLSQAGKEQALYELENLKKRSSLSQEEANIFGINAGESLYNLGPELLTTTAADKSKLISKNEVARQLALAKLAGLDKSKILNDKVLYDINEAGTQNALSAANLEGLRNRINQEKEQFDIAAKNKKFESNVGPRVSLEEKLGWSGYKTGDTGYKYSDNNALQDILLGKEYTPGTSQLAGTEGENLLSRQPDSWRTNYGLGRNTDLINAIESSGFLNKAQIVENEAAKARAEALRKILASRDKTNV
jgi:hypothetical protein